MIKQRPIIVKSADATLTVAEMGDIVANSSSALTITLPSPSPGLWYRFSNANSGLVNIVDNSTTMTTLKQAEQCLCLSNGASGWFFSKGGGAMTKNEIEAVLTGVISSHKHILSGSSAPSSSTAAGFVGQFYLETTTSALYQCTAMSGSTYTWTVIGGSSYTLPQATESDLGGIKASTKTTETNEVKIDPSTGKLYCSAPGEATNGIPAGGAAGQMLAKNSNNDYDARWVDAPEGGGGGTTKTILLCNLDTLLAGSNIASIKLPYGIRITEIKATVGTAPIGSNIIIDVNSNGTSIYTTQANRPTITAENTSVTAALPDTVDLLANNTISIDIDQIGSTIAGANLEVFIKGDIAISQLDSRVKLLLHCEGANGSTAFTDEAGHAVTVAGDAKISTAQYKIGSSSLLLDGNGDRLAIANSDDFNFGAGDFTIEFWMYSNVAWSSQPSSCGIMGQKQGDGTNGWVLYRDGGSPTKINARIAGGGDLATNTSPSQGVWEHWALTRESGVLKWWHNGTLDASKINTANVNDTTGTFYIGFSQTWSGYLNAYIDEVRITKGCARYSSDFTPATMPFDLNNKKFAVII